MIKLKSFTTTNGVTILRFEYDFQEAIISVEITEEDIADVVSQWTNIPVQRMLEEDSHTVYHFILCPSLVFVIIISTYVVVHKTHLSS